jgi:hypothetical protein
MAARVSKKPRPKKATTTRRKNPKVVRRTKGLVDWLLACPVKGFLEQPNFPDTTNDIKNPFE